MDKVSRRKNLCRVTWQTRKVGFEKSCRDLTSFKEGSLTSIGEDIRAVSRIQSFCDFYWQSHTEDWNQIPDEFLTQNVIFDLNYNESAALPYAHVKRCKLHKEADIAVPQSSTDWSTRSATGTTSYQQQKELSQLCSRLKERWLGFHRNRPFLVTQPMMIVLKAI